MNKKWLLAGTFVLVLICLFPPWRVELNSPSADHKTQEIVYCLVWKGPPARLSSGQQVENYELATEHLVVQVVWILILFGWIGLSAGAEGR